MLVGVILVGGLGVGSSDIHFNNLRFKQSQDIHDLSAAHVVIPPVSSEVLKLSLRPSYESVGFDICEYMCVYIYVRVCIYIYIYIYMCIYTYLCMMICMCVCIYIYIHIHVYIRIHTYIYIYIYIYTQIYTHISRKAARRSNNYILSILSSNNHLIIVTYLHNYY